MTDTMTFPASNANDLVNVLDTAREIVDNAVPRGLNTLVGNAVSTVLETHYSDCGNRYDCAVCSRLDTPEYFDELFARVSDLIIKATGAYRAPSADVLRRLSDMVSTGQNLANGIRDARAEGLIAIPEDAEVTVKFSNAPGKDFLVVLSAIGSGGFDALNGVHDVIGEILSESSGDDYTHSTMVGLRVEL